MPMNQETIASRARHALSHTSRSLTRWVLTAAQRIRLIDAAAYVWRRMLVRTTVVAVTGSVGKTTAKECLTAVLAQRYRVGSTRWNQNDRSGVPRTLLRLRPWHRVAVVEVGTARPGDMRRLARLVRPDIAIVLAVDRTHTSQFRDLEATAAEKAELVKALAPNGLAILNAEDPRVLAMSRDCRSRVVTFGRSPGVDVQADEVSSAWPQRLTFRVQAGAEMHRVHTQLVGEHWVSSVLAALQAGVACGVPLSEAANAVERVAPSPARMQPIALPSGAVIIRDENQSSPPALESAFAAFATSRAAGRRVLVISDISDSRRSPGTRLRKLGRRVAGMFDLVVFVGEHGQRGAAAAVSAGMEAGCARSFFRLRDAADYLASELRRGDVALLKGRTTDHLSRLVFAQFGKIACWKPVCRRTSICDVCSELGAPVRALPAPPIGA